MNLQTICWKNNKIRIIDQTRLPVKLAYLDISTLQELREAIQLLRVRGAPALGAAAGLGVYLGIKDSRAADFTAFSREMEKVIAYLGSSRPTARNLFWGLERMRLTALRHKGETIPHLQQRLFDEAEAIIEEDRSACRAIGAAGASLIKDGDSILTVCNAGSLATIDYGTAIGVMYSAHAAGKKIKVYACETRPLLQGSRLTVWELKQNGLDVTLLCDNMVASLMGQGKVDKVIVGADRIVANGDTANKIGTQNAAIISAFYRVPFYVAAPASTFDLSIGTGKGIPIEQRASHEVTSLFFKEEMSARGVHVYNPAFDVTPHGLITAIITDKGVIRPPFRRNIVRVLK